MSLTFSYKTTFIPSKSSSPTPERRYQIQFVYNNRMNPDERMKIGGRPLQLKDNQ